MKVLMTAAPVPTHVAPLIHVARGLVQRGHEVIIAVHHSLHPVHSTPNIHFEPAGQDWISPLIEPFRARPEITADAVAELMNQMLEDGFLGEPAAALAGDVTSLIARHRPDVIVRESYEFGGYLAAESTDIPLAVIGVTGMVSHFLPDAAIDVANNKWGISSTVSSGAERSRGKLYAEFMPPSFDVELAKKAQVRHFHRTHQPHKPVICTPTRPLIYVSLGTVAPLFQAASTALQKVMIALGEIACDAIVTTGGLHLPDPPANVQLMRRAEQVKLLDQASLFVTHCGYTSVQESTRAGVPMIGIPWIAENGLIAKRASELGIATILPWDDLEVEQVRAAIKSSLENPETHTTMTTYRDSLMSLPGDDYLLDAIERLGEL